MVIRGLDDYIMGVHDPNAPFNQIDWVEEFEEVLCHCLWLTDIMLDVDKTYKELGKLMDDAACEVLNLNNRYYTTKEKYQALKDNAEKIADCFSKKVYEKIQSGEAKWMYVINTNKLVMPDEYHRFLNKPMYLYYNGSKYKTKLFKTTQKAYDTFFLINSVFKGYFSDVEKILIFNK